MSALEGIHAAIDRIPYTPSYKSEISLPLVRASLDSGAACLFLIRERPERGISAATALARTQMEQVLRAAFFANKATRKEASSFLAGRGMPKRAKQKRKPTITLRELTREAFEGIVEEPTKLADVVCSLQNTLSSSIHGGPEIVVLYGTYEPWGPRKIAWEDMCSDIRNVLACSLLGLSVAMSLSSETQQTTSDLVRGAYSRVHELLASSA